MYWRGDKTQVLGRFLDQKRRSNIGGGRSLLMDRENPVRSWDREGKLHGPRAVLPILQAIPEMLDSSRQGKLDRKQPPIRPRF